MRIKPKLFLLLKLCLFNLLAMVSLYAHAEYYLVYSTPEFYDMCSNCQPTYHRHHHKRAVKTQRVVTKTVVTKKIHHARRHYQGGGGLYVYYPVMTACPYNVGWSPDNAAFACCPLPNRVRSQWGDYVVFTSRPADTRYGVEEEEESSFNPDLRTADDRGADLQVN